MILSMQRQAWAMIMRYELPLRVTKAQACGQQQMTPVVWCSPMVLCRCTVHQRPRVATAVLARAQLVLTVLVS